MWSKAFGQQCAEGSRSVSGRRAEIDDQPSQHGENLSDLIRRLNPILRGFMSYFRVANGTRVIRQLMGWLRRRLRCLQLK
ncbi:group II intron maturase-specific domain-containing protein [Marinobacter sp.]|uniref:group II intron maturase-specific domain-containing protein n=1 Tax=Marinobacter sp. TaxID=50741 RepID=UPI003A929168